jgi:hypothetical protein
VKPHIENPLGRLGSMRCDLLRTDEVEVPESEARVVPDAREFGSAEGVERKGGDAIEVGKSRVGAGAC